MEKYTPMMEQYLKVKEEYKDALLFYRLGDFYELFFEDAKLVSKELDLILTGKSAGTKEKVPMCGVPYHSASPYINKLLQKGYKIAIAEQLEDPKEVKGIVKRDVIRVITPGTIIDELNDDKNSYAIASIYDYSYGYSLILLDMSKSLPIYINLLNKNDLIQTLKKNFVKEVVIDYLDNQTIESLRNSGIYVSYSNNYSISEIYNNLLIDIKDDRANKAFALLINYLENTSKTSLSHLSKIQVEDIDEYLFMDMNTINNLELIEPLRTGYKNDTLWSFMDYCDTSMGSRLLKKWIEKPLKNKDLINNRYDIIDYLRDNFFILSDIKDHLKNIYDLDRIISKIGIKTCNVSDVVRLIRTLKEVPFILDNIKSDLFKDINNVDSCFDLYTYLNNAIRDDAPALLKDGSVFKKGFNKELDDLYEISKNGKKYILEIENREKERTKIKNLKIGYNKVFGYYIEISKGQIKEVKPEFGYIRKQTLTNGERYITNELKEIEDEILHSEEKINKLHEQLFNEIIELIKTYIPKLLVLSNTLETIDCYCSLTTLSNKYNYVRPIFDNKFELKEAKHPILNELMKKNTYVSNDLYLDDNKYIQIITGPNMGGKSTYMRQTALIVIMAQAGSFVPCKSISLPIFDKIYTRIGASDDILSGQSTFMVEMLEANNALKNATKNSLILFDEIGRGTSTYDGMALAQAIIEYIATNIKAKTLFSTHYHELVSLESNIDSIKNVYVDVKENKGNITFLYKIKDGISKKSYGINVAKLAKLPDSVIDRSKALLTDLESNSRVVQQTFQIVEMEKKDENKERLYSILNSIDPNNITPIQALQLISDLKSLSEDKDG